MVLRADFFFTLFLGASKILSSFASSRGLSSIFGTFAGFVGSLANKNWTNDSTGSSGLYGKHHYRLNIPYTWSLKYMFIIDKLKIENFMLNCQFWFFCTMENLLEQQLLMWCWLHFLVCGTIWLQHVNFTTNFQWLWLSLSWDDNFYNTIFSNIDNYFLKFLHFK